MFVAVAGFTGLLRHLAQCGRTKQKDALGFQLLLTVDSPLDSTHVLSDNFYQYISEQHHKFQQAQSKSSDQTVFCLPDDVYSDATISSLNALFILAEHQITVVGVRRTYDDQQRARGGTQVGTGTGAGSTPAGTATAQTQTSTVNITTSAAAAITATPPTIQPTIPTSTHAQVAPTLIQPLISSSQTVLPRGGAQSAAASTAPPARGGRGAPPARSSQDRRGRSGRRG